MPRDRKAAGGRHRRISARKVDPKTPRGEDGSFGALTTMLLPVLLLLLPLQDPQSAQGRPLYMRLPPSTLQGEPGGV